MTKISSVAIVGGTHGNEFSGIYLVKKWEKHQDLIARDGLTVETLLANPKAFKANKRYIDSDLNRQFCSSLLSDLILADYEQSRAKVINQYLGPKEKPRCDFIIDLHNTTSNMGTCLLLAQKHPIYNLLSGYVKLKMPEVNISRDEDYKSRDQHHLLATLSRFGVIVEVGPQAQACLRQDVLDSMEKLTQHILDFITLYNQDALPKLPEQIEAYLFLEEVKLPQDNSGERQGIVHKNIEGADFKRLNPGEPIFITLDGEVITYQGKTAVYPYFINEAAYYDSNLAMSLSKKVTIDVYS